MIDELVLEQLVAEIADEIAVPTDGAQRVAHELAASGSPARGATPRFTHLAMVAAAVIVIVGAGALINSATRNSTTAKSSGPTVAAATPTVAAGVAQSEKRAAAVAKEAPGAVGNVGPQGPFGVPVEGGIGLQGPTGAQGVSPVGASPVGPSTPTVASGPVDGAMIVKTASINLQIPKGALTSAVLRVTNIANGVDGYVFKSQTSFSSSYASAALTIRVPVDSFETAIKQLETSPGVKVLDDSESGVDVTAQYVNLQAELTADTGERDSLLTVLADANTIGDILAVHDRITAVQAEMDEIQGRLNVLSNQSTYSSIAVLLNVQPPPPPKPAVVRAVHPPTGLERSWTDARQGFAHSVEWFIARSGGALIIFLVALILLFAVRYLYPVVRRALL